MSKKNKKERYQEELEERVISLIASLFGKQEVKYPMVFGSNGRLLPQKKRWRASHGFDPVWLCELYSATKKRKSYLLITHLAVI
jgi:hypothetical protein